MLDSRGIYYDKFITSFKLSVKFEGIYNDNLSKTCIQPNPFFGMPIDGVSYNNDRIQVDGKIPQQTQE